jgi:hypothetical protein
VNVLLAPETGTYDGVALGVGVPLIPTLAAIPILVFVLMLLDATSVEDLSYNKEYTIVPLTTG